ncbi:hypothetical protein E2C01_069979 [Portunus trituberculatus]|uniref:Uncharacterized protein n=1 Tax=Portunus trituberculatus TaxID=210409 RepID=A0A5B7I103_PORTR|nr:hypothetical protein [Portunus trituberculatus]
MNTLLQQHSLPLSAPLLPASLPTSPPPSRLLQDTSITATAAHVQYAGRGVSQPTDRAHRHRRRAALVCSVVDVVVFLAVNTT